MTQFRFLDVKITAQFSALVVIGVKHVLEVGGRDCIPPLSTILKMGGRPGLCPPLSTLRGRPVRSPLCVSLGGRAILLSPLSTSVPWGRPGLATPLSERQWGRFLCSPLYSRSGGSGVPSPLSGNFKSSLPHLRITGFLCYHVAAVRGSFPVYAPAKLPGFVGHSRCFGEIRNCASERTTTTMPNEFFVSAAVKGGWAPMGNRTGTAQMRDGKGE